MNRCWSIVPTTDGGNVLVCRCIIYLTLGKVLRSMRQDSVKRLKDAGVQRAKMKDDGMNLTRLSGAFSFDI